MVDLYCRLSGREVGDLSWFQVLALWKATVFCEAIYGRYLKRDLDHDAFAATLERGVPALAAAASRIAQAA
jgi:aminoglycoside phosphotransferase (APT) family kinase protein